jgi:hypothetical protein
VGSEMCIRDRLHLDEQHRMKCQLDTMQDYSDILGERIEHFN